LACEVRPLTVYRIPERKSRPVRDSFTFAAIWLLGFSFIERLAHGHWDSPVALAVGGCILLSGGIFTRWMWPPKVQDFALEIDDVGMRSFWNGAPFRKVRKNHVLYVHEKKSFSGKSLIVSEQESFGKRMFDRATCMIVPEALLGPEQYELVRAQCLAWLQESSQSN
jgi:hypothetical protein